MRLVWTSWPRAKYFLVRQNQTKFSQSLLHHMTTKSYKFWTILFQLRLDATNGRQRTTNKTILFCNNFFLYYFESGRESHQDTAEDVDLKINFTLSLNLANGCLCLLTPAYDATPHSSITYVRSVEFQMEIKIICYCSFRSQTTQILVISPMFCRRLPKFENTRAELMTGALPSLPWSVCASTNA